MENGASSYRRFLDGDDEGFCEIVRAYKDGLTLYINSYVKNIYVAEDLTEDTFFRLLVKKPKFSEKSSFKTFLYSIGRNITIDYLRRNSTLKEISLLDIEKLNADESELESAYIKNEEKLLIYRCISDLCPEYRAVIWLLYVEGFSYKETRKILNKSDGQMKNLVYRAKNSLKNKIEKEDFI